MIKFNGLVGVLIFLATVVLLAIIVSINSAIYFFGRTSTHPVSKWPKYLLLSAIILLIFDGVFFASIFLRGNNTFTQDEAIALTNVCC